MSNTPLPPDLDTMAALLESMGVTYIRLPAGYLIKDTLVRLGWDAGRWYGEAQGALSSEEDLIAMLGA